MVEIKMAGITDYFQRKEMDLHSKLEAQEQTGREFETTVNEAEKKARAREVEREQYRRTLDDLRAEMKLIETSYIGQIKSHERRAEECVVSCF